MTELGTAEKLKVFVSYSRLDMAFADRLVEALKTRGFDVRIDRRDLPKLEDWRRELLHLIRQADTIVLIVSNNSLASQTVGWEVEQVRLFGKRLAPVVISDVSDLSIPPEVSRINYVFFTDPDQFELSVDELASALKTDVAWLKEHTRLNELALRWDGSGKPGDALIRGRELAGAEAWAERRPQDMPPVTEVQREFLGASRLAETDRVAREARQKRRWAQVIASLLLLIAASLMYAGWSNRPYLRARLAQITDLVEHKKLSSEAEQALKPLDTFSECSGCPIMIVIPAGNFTMGSPDSDQDRQPTEVPNHPVTISHAFAVSQFEVTFQEWDTCLALGGCKYEPLDLDFGHGTEPVININWDDAVQYVAWLAKRTGKPYRLLSEAEWEYAARAGSTTRYPWGDTIIPDKDKPEADCASCGSSFDDLRTAPVGSFPANGFKLFDMIGNVWEWVEDCWHTNYQDAPRDGSAWITACSDDSVRVLRGGGWNDVPRDVRSASRFAPGISARTRVNGIRVGRSLTQ